MAILPFMPLAEGYEPSTPELNTEVGILDISHPSDCLLIEDSKIVAETLILRCRLRPLPLLDKTSKVRLISEGESLREACLYAEKSVTYGYEKEVENSQWAGIALDYSGIGREVYEGDSFVFYGKNLLMGKIESADPLYIKPFIVERGYYEERTTTLASGDFLTSPPGALNGQVLRGYGGYYKPGIPLEEIQQIYYGLISTHNQTQVKLITTLTLQAQHTPPPHGGQNFNMDVIFNPQPCEEERLTLPGAMAGGYARCFVVVNGEKIPYSSFLCEPVLGHPMLVNIYFRPTFSHEERCLPPKAPSYN